MPPSSRPMLESLEDRTLLAASLTATLKDGVLHITGTEQGDTIQVRLNMGRYQVVGLADIFSVKQVARIEVDALGGDDVVNLGPWHPLLPGGGAVAIPTVVRGGTGVDQLIGGTNRDLLFGEDGKDTLRGGLGPDFLDGGLKDDSLDGGSGNDILFGDDGNDTLIGGIGSDSGAGGTGINRIVLDPSFTGKTDRIVAGAGWFDTNVADLALRSLSRYLQSDRALTRSDALTLFDQVGADDAVSGDELAGWRALVGAGAILGMPDPVRVLAGKVVNPHAANAVFTGGAATTQPLGDLQAGSTDAHLQRLVDKWFRGLDRPTFTEEATEYRSFSGQLFQAGASMLDVAQGRLGDCYFLAGLAGVARKRPALITGMFTDNLDGTFTVRFFHNGVADYVTVDRSLPVDANGRLVYASKGRRYDDSTNELWAALAEKAYAQLNEAGWLNRPTGKNGVNTYAAIETGGGLTAIEQQTGRTPTRVALNTITVQQVRTALASGDVVEVGGEGHVYVVLSLSSDGSRVQVFNPWHRDAMHDPGLAFTAIADNDGIVEVSWAVFTGGVMAESMIRTSLA
ncbi:MAG: C2 family cysteine protease [Gemmataceae bacterium]